MIFRFIALCVFITAAGITQDVSVPIEKEPHHKTVFKNAYVQAFRVSLEPGTTGLMHTHTHDDAAVRLTTAIVAADSPGAPLGPPEPVYPGFVSARDNEHPSSAQHRHHALRGGGCADSQQTAWPDGSADLRASGREREDASVSIRRRTGREHVPTYAPSPLSPGRGDGREPRPDLRGREIPGPSQESG